MASFSRENRTVRLLRGFLFDASILSIPTFLYFLTLFALFLLFGGQHFAIIGTNPFCQLPSKPFNSTAPPSILIHISDLHISDTDRGKAQRKLLTFEQTVLPNWGPLATAILVSGDLVHAIHRPPRPLGTRSVQSRSEWNWLNEFAARVNRTVPWVSTIGNHDTFGGRPHQHDHLSNLTYLTCPSAPTAKNRVRLHQFSGGDLSVIAVDGTLQYPIHRPLNFFGDASLLAPQLARVLDEVHDDPGGYPGNVIIFGHYPSAVMAAGKSIHQLAQPESAPTESMRRPRFAAYLSGHLHNLYGFTKNGLQSVSKSGALELESIDMAGKSAFRVLAFEGSTLSFKTFFMDNYNSSTNYLNDVLVTNLPQAGLCSAGAGTAAMRSTHIRMISPFSDLTSFETHVYIDDTLIGPVIRLDSLCAAPGVEGEKRAHSTCKSLYGVRWNPSMFSKGTHRLILRNNEALSDPFIFSLDGSPDVSSWEVIMETVISVLFNLSNFESMATILCTVPLVLSAILCIPGILKRKLGALVIALLGVGFLMDVPILIARGLSADNDGIGWIGLRRTVLPTVTFKSGVDAPFIFSGEVMWASLLPVSFLLALVNVESVSSVLRSPLLFIFGFALLRRCWSWCMEILGAYGLLAVLVSPCGLPLFIVSCFSIYSAFERRRCLNRNRQDLKSEL